MANKKKPTAEPIRVVLPKKIMSGVTAKVNPNDFNAIGTQYRELALMPFLNASVNDLRKVWEMTRLLRHLMRIEGPISTATFNLVQVADSGYTAGAYDANTGHYDPDASDVVKNILARMDALPSDGGFSTAMSTTALLQMMLREVIITNGVSAELVLDKGLMPSKINVVGMETLRWIKDDDGEYKPAQRRAGDTKDTNLAIPTFFVQRAVGDPTDIIPRSMMEAAVKMLIFFEEIIEDIRKTLKQTGYARNVITLDLEKIAAAAPRDIRNDSKKFGEFCEAVRVTVEQSINNIDPDEALVMFNTASYEIKSANFGKNTDYTPLMNQISGMYATSMKTPPTVLGMRMDSGSQALGNVETLIFIKGARAIQLPVETVMSRALTLAARLYGLNVVVKFKFKPINLRPDIETEAFKTQRQTRILELLSLGFLTDEEAAEMLETRRPPGAPKLSGTFFQVAMGEPGPPAADDTSAPNGGKSNQPKPGDTPIGKTLQPDSKTPRKGGGKSQ